MPSKRTAAGFFAPGEKAYETFLRADGCKSEYGSVQKLLNHLARRIKSEGSRECYLSWVHRYCRKVGKGPDEVVDAESPLVCAVRRTNVKAQPRLGDKSIAGLPAIG